MTALMIAPHNIIRALVLADVIWTPLEAEITSSVFHWEWVLWFWWKSISSLFDTEPPGCFNLIGSWSDGVKGMNSNVTLSWITIQCVRRSCVTSLPKTTNWLQGVTMYFLDHSFILHMLNLSDVVIKAVVDMKQEILCDADVSLAM